MYFPWTYPVLIGGDPFLSNVLEFVIFRKKVDVLRGGGGGGVGHASDGDAHETFWKEPQNFRW